jgi:hypothetical protein
MMRVIMLTIVIVEVQSQLLDMKILRVGDHHLLRLEMRGECNDYLEQKYYFNTMKLI